MGIANFGSAPLTSSICFCIAASSANAAPAHSATAPTMNVKVRLAWNMWLTPFVCLRRPRTCGGQARSNSEAKHARNWETKVCVKSNPLHGAWSKWVARERCGAAQSLRGALGAPYQWREKRLHLAADGVRRKLVVDHDVA